MTVRSPETLIRAFAGQISERDIRLLEPFLGEDIAARFDEAGELIGRRPLLEFWHRVFESYALFELHVLKSVTQGDLVIAENLYRLATRQGPAMAIRAITIFEVEADAIRIWRDRADLTDVPLSERDRWRRLGAARW